ncbi:MAG: hypothetical protein U0414_37225 [Polyangiaceae bacterium]
MSKRAKKTLRPNAAKRAADRDAERARKDLERLDALAEGATPARAIELVSPSEVEVRAEALPCPVCGGRLRMVSHDAETIDGRRVRVARTRCETCRAPRVRYFRIGGALLN